jgi:hypothetical protein
MREIISGLLAILLLICSVSARANELELLALAADQVGLTLQKSPVLYFYISEATSLPISFTLVQDREFTPVPDIPLKSPSGPGLEAIRLGDYQIVLEENVQYHWYVSVTRNPGSPSRDIVAGGAIERVDPFLVNYYGRKCDRDAVRYLQEANIWYDAFACVNELIDASPQDKSLRDLRDELLGRPKSFLYLLPTELLHLEPSRETISR